MKRAELKIYGSVQDVGFRRHLWQKAKDLDIVGWVKNELNGIVKVAAEGQEEKLKELIQWCEQGPTYAQVDKVEISWQKATGQFKDFHILR